MQSLENEAVDPSAKLDKARDFRWYFFGVFIFLVLVGIAGAVTYLKMLDAKNSLASVPVPVSPTPTTAMVVEVVVEAKKATKVEVLNGSGVAGAAKVASDKLKAKDKSLVVSVGNNSDEVSGTTVTYKDEGFKKGEFSVVAKSLWPEAEEKIDGSLTTDVRVVLGK